MFVLIADDDVRRVFINPQIISTSTEVSEYEEGCLSIPKVYEKITRPVKVTVQALNENGKPFTLEADGLLARIIQHEYDHLEGILYIILRKVFTWTMIRQKAQRTTLKLNSKKLFQIFQNTKMLWFSKQMVN